MTTTSASAVPISRGRSGPGGVTATHSERGQRTFAVSIVRPLSIDDSGSGVSRQLDCRRCIDLVSLVCLIDAGEQRVALKNIIGMDHAVVVVRDLDKSAENWKRLGFTVSPRGTHSAKMGSGNCTIMLDPDYMELLGVLVETEHNAPTRAFLAQRGEGIERVAFTAVDSAAGAEEIRARGFEPVGPTDFERPVTMPDGSLSAAKFSVFQWPIAEVPGRLRH